MARLRSSNASCKSARVNRNLRSTALCSTTCAIVLLLAISLRHAASFTFFRFSAASPGQAASAPPLRLRRHLSLARHAEGSASHGGVKVAERPDEEQAAAHKEVEEKKRKPKSAPASKAKASPWKSPPRIFSWVKGYKKLLRQKQLQVPGHLMQRQLRQKGRKDGYVIVPFPFATRSIVPDPEIPICLIGRRERQRNFLDKWQAMLDSSPAFDIRGTATPQHLDPIEPPVDWPLQDGLPNRNEIYEQVLLPERVGEYYRRKDSEVRSLVKELKKSGNGGVYPAELLASVVSRLPESMLTEENQPLIRSAVEELLGLLWTVHSACGGLSERLRWRFACIDNVDGDTVEDAAKSLDSPLSAIFVLAGDGVEFVPKPFVDENREAREVGLSQSQLESLSAEDWVRIVAQSNTNVTEALRRMPAGWTVLLKGKEWYGGKKGSSSAVWRMPSTGKRLIMQVDVVGKEAVKVAEPEVPTFSEIREGSTHKSDMVTTGKELLFMQSAVVGNQHGTSASMELQTSMPKEEQEEERREEESGFIESLGPLGALVAAVLLVLRKSAPYRWGQEKRREYRFFINSLQRLEDTSMESMEVTQELEQKLWMDFPDAAEAPVVLLIGGLTETGKVLSRKLILKGYHVVLLEDIGKRRRKYKWKIFRSVGRDAQGGIVAAVRANTQDIEWMTKYSDDVPEDLYNAVAGVDKMIICACDQDSKSPTYSQLRGILAAWKEYKRDFSECNRSQASTLTLFSFKDEVSRSLWALETRNPSDSCYGAQYAAWERNPNTGNAAMLQGTFFEAESQTTLLSPTLRLNFKSFSALMLSVYSYPDAGETSTTFSFILRTEDFESTRVQYEFEFTVGEGYQTVRMPFAAFKAIRADGVAVPADEAQPLQRTSVTQLGVVKRNSRRVFFDEIGKKNRGERFLLDILRIGVSKIQVQPDVVYMGPLPDGQDVEEASEEKEEEEEMSYAAQYEAMLAAEKAAEEELETIMAMADESATAGIEVRRKSRKGVDPKRALIDSGMVYTILHVNGVNNHPGGKYPLTMSQLPVDAAPLSGHTRVPHAKFISRGDAAELAMSSLTEPACRNAEVFVGELSPNVSSSETDMGPFHEMRPTSQDDVGSYLKKLSPSV